MTTIKAPQPPSEKIDYKENRVLFVDDEPNVISALRRGIAGETYTKFFAVTAKEALQIMDENDIHVLVTDMRMPVMNGLELLKIVSEKHPSVIRIVLSGYAQLPQVLATINQVNVFRFIPKPWNMEDEFIPMIRSAIDYYNMTQEFHSFKTALEKQNIAFKKTIQEAENRYKQLQTNAIALDHFSHTMMTHFAMELKQKKYAAFHPSEIGDKLEDLNIMLTGLSEIFPFESTTFAPEQLRSSLSAIVKNIPSISEETGMRTFKILHDQQQIWLTGNYKLYVYLQQLIFTKLILHKPLESLKLSEVYDAQTKSILLQYQFQASSLPESPWDLQLILFLLTEVHQLLPGKFYYQKEDNLIIVKSLCQCSIAKQ